MQDEQKGVDIDLRDLAVGIPRDQLPSASSTARCTESAAEDSPGVSGRRGVVIGAALIHARNSPRYLRPDQAIPGLSVSHTLVSRQNPPMAQPLSAHSTPSPETPPPSPPPTPPGPEDPAPGVEDPLAPARHVPVQEPDAPSPPVR